MKDIAARELKGHNILAVERFWDSTCWMIEFTVLRPTAYGEPGDEMRLFLTEDGYQSALQSQQRREIKIKRYAHVIEGHKIILNLEDDEAERVQETLHLSDAETMEVTHFERGSGLISTNNNNIMVEFKASPLEKDLITTDRRELRELLERKRQEQADSA